MPHKLRFYVNKNPTQQQTYTQNNRRTPLTPHLANIDSQKKNTANLLTTKLQREFRKLLILTPIQPLNIILIYCPHTKGYKIDRAYSQHFKTRFSKPHFLLLSNREYHSSHWTYPTWIKSRRYSERCRKRSKRVIVIYPKWWVRENTDGTYFNEEKIKSPKAP